MYMFTLLFYGPLCSYHYDSYTINVICDHLNENKTQVVDHFSLESRTIGHQKAEQFFQWTKAV